MQSLLDTAEREFNATCFDSRFSTTANAKWTIWKESPARGAAGEGSGQTLPADGAADNGCSGAPGERSRGIPVGRENREMSPTHPSSASRTAGSASNKGSNSIGGRGILRHADRAIPRVARAEDGTRRGTKRQRVSSEFCRADAFGTPPPPTPSRPENVALGEGPAAGVAAPAILGTSSEGGARSINGAGGDEQSISRCHYEGCTKPTKNASHRFCRRHVEGRRCKTAGCSKVDVGGGNCRKHGGGRRCGADGCLKTDVGGGFCVSHGGGKRCRADGCAKGAQAGGLFCKSHGGGRRCRIEGCMTSAQSGADVLCIKHGGGKRCCVPGCRKLVRRDKRCTKHASQGSPIVEEGVLPRANATRLQSSAASTATATPARLEPPAVARELPDSRSWSSSSRGGSWSPPRPQSVDDEPPHTPPPKPDGSDCEQQQQQQQPPSTHSTIANGRTRGRSPDRRPRMMPSILVPSDGADGEENRNRAPQAMDFVATAAASTVLSRRVLGLGASADSPGPQPGVRPSSPPAASDGTHAFSDLKPRSQALVRTLDRPGDTTSRWPPDDERDFQELLPGFASLESSAPIRVSMREQAGRTLEHPRSGGGPAHPPSYSLLTRGYEGTHDAYRSGRGKGSAGHSILRDLMPLPHDEIAATTMLGLRDLQGSGRFRLRTKDLPPSMVPMLPSPRFAPVRGVHARGDAPRAPAYDGMAHSRAQTVAGDVEARVQHDVSATGRSHDVLSRTGGTPASTLDRLPQMAAVASEASAVDDEYLHPARAPNDTYHGGGRGISARHAAHDAVEGTRGSLSASDVRYDDEENAGQAQRIPGLLQARRPPSHTQAEGPDVHAGEDARTEERTNAAEADACPRGVPATSSQQASTFISLSVKDMMCVDKCGKTVQHALGAVPGVRNVTIHFPTRTASVQVEQGATVSVSDLTSAVSDIGFESQCVATSTTEEDAVGEAGVNAIWAIASALGLVDRGCAMAWGDECNCGDDCRCVNCPHHMKKVSHALDLVLKAVDLSSSSDLRAAPQAT